VRGVEARIDASDGAASRHLDGLAITIFRGKADVCIFAGAVTSQSPPDNEVDQFIHTEIETVPHLEALLLIWNSRPQPWTVENLAQRLYISVESVQILMEDLVRRSLVAPAPGSSESYRYQSDSNEKDRLMASVDDVYRRELIRVSRMIHSKPSAAVRAFARAFRITKERS
jgi:hypothetical protein